MRRTALFFILALVAVATVVAVIYKLGLSEEASAETDLRPEAVPTCGPRWRVDATANPSKEYNELHGLAVLSPTDAWAVGTYGTEQYALSLTEHWDGTRWTHVESPSLPDLSNHLYAVTAGPGGAVWAVGASHRGTDFWQTLVLRLEGDRWQVVPSPNSGPISSLNAVVALAADDVWAVGETSTGEKRSGSRPLIEHWDGAAWTIVQPPDAAPGSTLNAIAAISPVDIWAAGSTTDRSGDISKPLTMHWDGATWRAVDNPGAGSIWGLAALPTGEVWAAGNNGPQTLTMRYKDEAWQVVPSPSVGGGSNSLNAIAAISPTEVWAVGSRGGSAQVGDRTLAMRWDGSAWKVSPIPSVGDFVNALYAVGAVSQTEVLAAGSYITDNMGTNLALVERYSDPCAAP